jgi:hypothetical protein
MPKMMSFISDAYAAVRKLLEALPSSHHGYWWSADDLARILSTGRVENVNKEIITKALNNECRGTFQRDRTHHERYFLLGEHIQKGWSVELQFKASSIHWNLCSKTFMDWFKVDLSLTNAVKIIKDHDWTMPTPLAGDSKKEAHVQQLVQYTNWADKSPGGKKWDKENNALNVESGGEDDDSSSNDDSWAAWTQTLTRYITEKD